MMWRVVFLLAIAGTTVLADPRVAVPDIPNAGSRIVSGWEAREGQFPHMIALFMVNPSGTYSLCAATIIHEEWGLTAAHCTANRVALIIRAGSVSTSRPIYNFETTSWYHYPSYVEGTPSQPNDISLISFGRTITFSDRVKPIRIQRSSASFHNYEGTQAIASGWGRTETDGPSSGTLNWVYQSIISTPECRRVYVNHPAVQDTSICAGPYNVTSQSICLGDSGGPLTIIDDDGELTQVGISSFMMAAGCHLGFPSGFVRPGAYHDWITEVTGIDFDWEYNPADDS